MPDETTGNFHTFGGFVMHFIGHIPQSGEHFEWDGLRFEVMDMDGTRVDKVLIMSLATTDLTANDETN